MFLLSFCGVTKPYSTLEMAEKSAAFHLKRFAMSHPLITEQWNEAFQKEDFRTCVMIWNDYNRTKKSGDPLFFAWIRQEELDRPFL